MHIKYSAQNSIKISSKPKVYFSCHPDDFRKHKDEITNDLFLHNDCAVYYYEPNTSVPENTKEFDLSHMRVFVFAVTKKFLTLPNTAFDNDLKYAIKNHIHIIPIVVEPVAEALLVEKFGSLQYLDKTKLTPESYKDKLEFHTQKFTSGKKYTKKMEAALDGTIFLSYRKKDRSVARNVMRTIHRPDINRFLGIWYDEFLIPGEDFNDNIADCIKKSDIFVMVITPNIVENGNYVLSNEYPLAKKLNKIIIPIEAKKTDRSLLEKTFPGIPPCVGVRDFPKIAQLLKDALKDKPKKTRNLDDFYYMGLAYIEGINVELDVKKGLELIKFAAKKHRLTALSALVDMYRFGDNVKQSFDEAIKWQTMLVENQERITNKKNIVQNRGYYYASLYTLAHMLNEQERYEEAEAITRKGISVAEQYSERDDYRLKYKLYTLLVGIVDDCGKYDEAMKIYNSFIGELEAKEKRDSKFNSQLCATYNTIMRIYERHNDLNGVRMMARKNREVVSRSNRELQSNVNTPYALTYLCEARTYVKENNYVAAESLYKKALSVYNSFKNHNRWLDVLNMHGVNSEIGNFYKKWNKPHTAIPYLKEAIRYVKYTNMDTKNKRTLLLYTIDLADAYFLVGNYYLADITYRECEDYYMQLCKLDPDNYKEENGRWHAYFLNRYKELKNTNYVPRKPSLIDELINAFAEIGNIFIEIIKSFFK